ncbi:hypothetical protein GCM10023097_35160 [Streptomyces collinus]
MLSGGDCVAAVDVLRAESAVSGHAPQVRPAAELPNAVLVCGHAADLLDGGLSLLNRRTRPVCLTETAQTAFHVLANCPSQ